MVIFALFFIGVILFEYLGKITLLILIPVAALGIYKYVLDIKAKKAIIEHYKENRLN